jgi:capsular exopolysaccharide synthesis family protein
MASDASTIDAAPAQADMDAAMIARLGLSSEALHAIYELMQDRKLSLPEAAVRLGFATQVDAAEALADAAPKKPASGETAGLIENAIRKIAANRQVIVRQGDTVKIGPSLVHTLDADNPRSEKIRALRTELLLLSTVSSDANIIALLSPSASEGRSQLAAELAISFSQLGRRTLLVDADLRKPSQHVLFGSSNITGLADAISRNQKPVFHRVDALPHLSLLTSGILTSNPLELLSDGRFQKMIQDWRKTLDFVVLDTPPVQGYADGLAIATLAGRVLLVSRGQHTTFKDTGEMLRRLATTQSQILGGVINHF